MRRRPFSSNIQFIDEQIENYALTEIENLLKQYGRSLKDFERMPIPDKVVTS